MNEKVVKSKKMNSLIKRIRENKNREIVLNKPNLSSKTRDGEKCKTILTIENGRSELGTVNTRSYKESVDLIKNTKKIKINIGWDKNRNEKLVASFIK
jgi:hypothetical protein